MEDLLSPTHEAALLARRIERMREALSRLDFSVTSHILPPSQPLLDQLDTSTTSTASFKSITSDPSSITLCTPEMTAATRLQCAWRRYEAKKQYRELLHQHYLEEEDRLFSRRQRAVDATMQLLDSIRLQQENKDRQWIEQGMRQLRRRSAYNIQRWWTRKRSSSSSSSLPPSRKASIDEDNRLLAPVPQHQIWNVANPIVKKIWQSSGRQGETSSSDSNYPPQHGAVLALVETGPSTELGISVDDISLSDNNDDDDDYLYELSASEYDGESSDEQDVLS